MIGFTTFKDRHIRRIELLDAAACTAVLVTLEKEMIAAVDRDDTLKSLPMQLSGISGWRNVLFIHSRVGGERRGLFYGSRAALAETGLSALATPGRNIMVRGPPCDCLRIDNAVTQGQCESVLGFLLGASETEAPFCFGISHRGRVHVTPPPNFRGTHKGTCARTSKRSHSVYFGRALGAAER